MALNITCQTSGLNGVETGREWAKMKKKNGRTSEKREENGRSAFKKDDGFVDLFGFHSVLNLRSLDFGSGFDLYKSFCLGAVLSVSPNHPVLSMM